MNRRKASSQIRDVLKNEQLFERQAREARRDARKGPKMSTRKPRLSAYLNPNAPPVPVSGIQDLRERAIQLGLKHKVLTWASDGSRADPMVQCKQLHWFIEEVKKHRQLPSWPEVSQFLADLFGHFDLLKEAFPSLRRAGFHPTYLRKILKDNPVEFLSRISTKEDTPVEVTLDFTGRHRAIHRAGREAFDAWPPSIDEVPLAVLDLLEKHLAAYPLLTGPTLKAVATRIESSSATELAVTEFVKSVFQS